MVPTHKYMDLELKKDKLNWKSNLDRHKHDSDHVIEHDDNKTKVLILVRKAFISAHRQAGLMNIALSIDVTVLHSESHYNSTLSLGLGKGM